jgi:hypothetical protein
MIQKIVFAGLLLTAHQASANECPVQAQEVTGEFLRSIRGNSENCIISLDDEPFHEELVRLELEPGSWHDLTQMTYASEVQCGDESPFKLNVDVYHYEDGLCINRGRVSKDVSLGE